MSRWRRTTPLNELGEERRSAPASLPLHRPRRHGGKRKQRELLDHLVSVGAGEVHLIEAPARSRHARDGARGPRALARFLCVAFASSCDLLLERARSSISRKQARAASPPLPSRAAAGTRQRLLLGVDGQDAVADRHAVLDGDSISQWLALLQTVS